MKLLELSTIFGEFNKLTDMANAKDDVKVVLIPDLFRVLDFYYRFNEYPSVEGIEIKKILAYMFFELQYKY